MLFIIPSALFAQQQTYIFQHLTTKDGLASDLTKFIFQDSKGFYWLGYDNGFQKFDGKNFSTVSFNNKYINTASLDGPVVMPVEDNDGNVYILNQGSIYVYGSGGKVDTINLFDYGDDHYSDIYSFCKDGKNNIWFVSERGIYQYDKVNRICRLWRPLETRKSFAGLTKIIFDVTNDCFWLVRNEHIFRIDPIRNQLSEPFFKNDPGITTLYKIKSFTAFCIDRDQNLWAGSWNGEVYKYNTHTYQKEVYEDLNFGKNRNQIDKSTPICLLADKQNTLWMGCNNGGLYSFDIKSKHFNPVSGNNNIFTRLHYNYSITFLYQDNEENIWVGTDRGLNIFNPSPPPFITVDENSPLSLFQKLEITEILETSKGNILVGTWGKGWFMYDQNFKLLKHYYDREIFKEKENAFSKNLVWCFAEDKSKNIWIGYQNGLLGLYKPATGKLTYMNVKEFEGRTIMCMKFDEEGNLWFGLHSGFLVKRGAVQPTYTVYKNALQLDVTQAPVTDILIDKQNNVWVSTNGEGIYCFDPLLEKVKARYVGQDENSVFDHHVNTLTLLNDSIIGMSSEYKGLILLNTFTKKASQFTIQEGLPANTIWGIAKDRHGELWVAANNGLCKMNESGRSLVTFEEEDGLRLKKFNGNIEKLTNGRMIIPAETGFVYFDPDKIRDSPEPAEVQITGFSVFDSSLFLDSLLRVNNILRLNYNQNFFIIHYASLGFTGRNSTRYSFQLEGIDKEWIHAGTKRFTEYTNLSPGHYIFKVKCENREGISAKNITQLSILILPPWWSTWWAYSLYALVTAYAVYILYRDRMKKLKLQQAALIRIMIATQEEERKRISRDLHDEVGTKLSALKLFLSSLREKALEIQEEEIQLIALNSEKYITETLKDIRQLLLNLSPSVLEEFGYTTAVEGLVHKINETKQIHFSLVFFGLKQRLQQDYELALYRITQELINNVLKHAEAKNVELQIGQRDEKIILMIEDDGVGFDVKEHKEGYGLQNLEARTTMMEGTLTIDSQPGKGTTVLIEIPYGVG